MVDRGGGYWNTITFPWHDLGTCTGCSNMQYVNSYVLENGIQHCFRSNYLFISARSGRVSQWFTTHKTSEHCSTIISFARCLNLEDDIACIHTLQLDGKKKFDFPDETLYRELSTKVPSYVSNIPNQHGVYQKWWSKSFRYENKQIYCFAI